MMILWEKAGAHHAEKGVIGNIALRERPVTTSADISLVRRLRHGQVTRFQAAGAATSFISTPVKISPSYEKDRPPA
jgi:hypothetical protein